MAATANAAKRRIAVAMSGGVDSSVAAYLLAKKYEITGVYMENWNSLDEDSAPPSCLEQDVHDAQAVCSTLHIPLHRACFAAEYWNYVFGPFLEGISQGHMPNPDIKCNSLVKFGAMKTYVQERLGIDWIATGHYARLWNRQDPATPPYLEPCLEQHSWLENWGTINDEPTPLLLVAADRSKDQSYVLAGVEGSAFRNVLFPLGDLHKVSKGPDGDGEISSVRQLAAQAQLPTAQKRESMGICFVGKRKFGAFITQYLPNMHGSYVDIGTGETVGEGSLMRTIGQGAKISGVPEKMFVVGRDDSTLYVCAGTHHPALYSSSLYLRSVNWIGASEPPPLQSSGTMRCKCRIRHLQPLVDCAVTGSPKDGYTIHFDTPLRAISPGQLAALYLGDDGLLCLGGGAITQRGPTYHEQGLELPSELHPAGHNDLSINRDYG